MSDSEYNELLVQQLIKNTGLNKKICTKYLQKNGFDIEKAAKEIRYKMESGQIENAGSIASGIVYGNVSNASTVYGMNKFNTPRGHGFAAERANHLYDRVAGKDAKIVGDNNAKNGADRIVGGVNIQSKYCATGSRCISECFENGRFRYINPDGTPMKIEVPSDKYQSAVKAMEDRIRKGEVPGVRNPNEASNIVQSGHFTYEQAKNIARFGKVESITYDAVNGAVIASTTFGISTVLTFAVSIWNGYDFDIALKNAAFSGLKVGGVTFATAILSSQLSRTGLNSALVGSSEAIVSLMGPKASAMLVNAFRSGSNIYGAAAMKSAAKVLRGNAITGAVSVVVLSSFDVVNIFRGRISGSQLFKNIANTASTVAGGTAGWIGGAATGAAIGSVFPIIGSAIGGVVGGIIGSFAGGAVAGTVSEAVLDEFIEDDAKKMVSIIEEVFGQMADDYLINKEESERIVDKLEGKLSGSVIKDMYAYSDRKKFASMVLEPLFENEVQKRGRIKVPTDKELAKGLRFVLEDLEEQYSM